MTEKVQCYSEAHNRQKIITQEPVKFLAGYKDGSSD